MKTVYRDERCLGVEIRWDGEHEFHVWVEGKRSHFFTHIAPGPVEAAKAAMEHFDALVEDGE